MKTTLKAILVVVSVIMILPGCKKETVATGKQADNLPETQPAIQTAVNANITSNIGGFYKALPALYDSTSKKYPLLIFLHGVGELEMGRQTCLKYW
jgi:hypothetical protein